MTYPGKEVKVKELTLKGTVGMGHYDDVDGNRWDVHSVIGVMGAYLCHARMVDASPKYSTASENLDWSVTYSPYRTTFLKD